MEIPIAERAPSAITVSISVPVPHSPAKRQADPLSSTVYRWTGVDPFIVRQIMGHCIAK